MSKDYLTAVRSFERVLIYHPGYRVGRQVTLSTERKSESVDAATRTVTEADGATIGYGTPI